MEKISNSRHFRPHDHAVSEIVGTLILIVIAISAFSAISIIVLNPFSLLSDNTPPEITLVGFIQDDNVIIEHRGGVALDQKTKITIVIENVSSTFDIGSSIYWDDENNNGIWNIGERVIYPGGGLQNKQVTCLIIDMEKNCIVFDKIIQKGLSVFSPYISALPPDDVTETSATLKMYYNFFNLTYFSSGSLNFTYGVFGGPYGSTPPAKPLSLNGWYGQQRNGLLSGTKYEYWAWMNYSNGTKIHGPISFYTYQPTRGFWPFDEPANSTIAHDVINPVSDGTVYGAKFIANGKVNGSLNFSGVSNYVDIPHHHKMNLSNEMTIETWVNISKIGAQFPGNVSEITTKNMSAFLGNTCFEPDLIKIDGIIYAVAYRDNISAYVTTFQMDDNGVFLGIIDTKSIVVPHFYEPDIINIDGIVYTIAYGASDDQTEAKNHILTLRIYNNGTIGDVIDNLDFPSFYGREPNVLHIDSDVYAIVVGGDSYGTYQTGYLVTLSIDTSGNIGAGFIDTIKFPNSPYCSEASIIHMINDLYAITYNGYGNTSGYIITIRILNDGSIIEPVEEIHEYSLPENGLEPTIIHVINDIYAISFGADSNNQLRTGFIQTIKIDSSGHIVNDSIDILPFYTYLSPIDYNFETDIHHIDEQLYAISFTGGNNSNWKRGFLTTVQIADSGNISDTALFIYEFKGHSALNGATMLNLVNHPDQLIVVYGSINSSDSGFLTMEKIDLIGEQKSIIRKGDAFAIMVNYDLVTAWMSIGNSTYTVSSTISFDAWERIDFTYGSGFLKLYINDLLQTGASTPCTGSVKNNIEHFVVGAGLFGAVDEVKIFRGVYVPP